MALSLILVKKIASLLIIVFLGFIMVKLKVLKSEDSRMLSKLMLYCISPVMIINAFQVDRTSEVINGLLAAALMSVIVFGLSVGFVMLIRKPLKLTNVEQASIEYTNNGNLVIPLVIALFGDEWVIFTLACISVHMVFQWSHLISLISGEKKIDVKKILTNVNMICVFIGLVMFLLNIRLPAVVKDATQMVSDMIGPVAMLILGMILGGMDLKSIFLNKRAYLVSLLRLVAIPAIMLAVYKLLKVDSWIANGETIMMISFLACCSATANNVVAMSKLADADSEYAGVINILTSLLCIITMPVFIALYQLF